MAQVPVPQSHFTTIQVSCVLCLVMCVSHVCIFSCHGNISGLFGKLSSGVIFRLPPACVSPAHVIDSLSPLVIVFTCKPELKSLHLPRSCARSFGLVIF